MYRIDTFDGRLGLLLEDFGGVSLKQILSTYNYDRHNIKLKI
jgi:hypothetical protein